MKYIENILDLVGNTPLIKLQVVGKNVKPSLFVKLESLNPGGSIKDRMALQIINDAEKSKKIKKGSTIIECTGSGNTGIGLALIAAIRGYKTIFTMPDKNSQEKISLLKAYGAEVIVCPTNVSPDDPRSYYKVAEKLANEIPNSFFAKQYFNASNPTAHYNTTGPEIWEQTDGQIDYVVAGMGTGGTITGIGKFLKEKNTRIKVIGIDPIGSIYHEYFLTNTYNSKPKTYLIEGIGEDFIPETIDFSYIDDIVQVSDKEAYHMSRKLARDEGILVGTTSGAAVAGILKYIAKKDIQTNKNIVVMLPDSGRSYLSKIFNDTWMQEQNLL